MDDKVINMDIFSIFFAKTTLAMMSEIVLRCIVMYLIIIIFLRLTGKRGIRQLSIFEVAIILCLGSAAGDPMFAQDLPLSHAALIFLVILILYRFTTWIMMKSKRIEDLLEGKAMYVVQDGRLIHKDFRKKLYSQDEFFSEMRNESIEHLGQVRAALLESDGSISLLYYQDSEVKWGLPIFPNDYVKVNAIEANTFYSCMLCGETSLLTHADQACHRCHHTSWAKSSNTLRIG